jgi:glyoxylase-like metal-dependent hydrolase (beta-lactamase superfamily II)
MRAKPVADGVYRMVTLMSNVFFLEQSGQWVLVDAGLPGYSAAIRREASRLFSTPPAAILLTHGHFDHVGSVDVLSRAWRVPVYAHPLEMPYLTGRSAYPPPDPTVGGGTQSWFAPLMPRGPIDLGTRTRMLPPAGAVPVLDEWQWVATPGHTPGHVSFYRPSDGALVAGDAVVTTRQESTMHVLTQRERVWRPPAYFTTDWIAARRSVEQLALLEPNVLATGHGHAMYGEEMRTQLRDLAANFDRVMPSHGRYVPYPAIADERGVLHVPPRVPMANTSRAALAIAAAGATMAVVAMLRNRTPRSAAG